jgi:hypothetical protein
MIFKPIFINLKILFLINIYLIIIVIRNFFFINLNLLIFMIIII